MLLVYIQIALTPSKSRGFVSHYIIGVEFPKKKKNCLEYFHFGLLSNGPKFPFFFYGFSFPLEELLVLSPGILLIE